MKIEELDISARSYNCLKRAGIDTVEKLMEVSDDALLRIRGMTHKCIEEVRVQQALRPVTGRDVLKGMSNAELSKVLSSACVGCIVRGCTIHNYGSYNCRQKFEAWLNQPVGR